MSRKIVMTLVCILVWVYLGVEIHSLLINTIRVKFGI